MSGREYNEKYIQHFTQPRNIGDMDNPDGSSTVHHEGGGCFDRIRMHIKVENGILSDIRYKLRACSGTIAASSAISVIAKGKTLEEALQIDFDAINDELGGVPQKKYHSIELAIEALREAIADYKES